MKPILRILAAGLTLVLTTWAEETPASSPGVSQAASWSLVYLPDLDWKEGEVAQTLALLKQLQPGLVVSVAPCPFAEAIRNLACKPAVLDKTQRANLGVSCGLPAAPLSTYADNSTLHTFGSLEGGAAGLVWLSAEQGKSLFNGPPSDREELHTFANMQVRKQLAERRGEVVFLIDPSVPTPADASWRLPLNGVNYEQAATGITGFACIRPGSLQSEIPPVEWIAPRVPVIHWIHSGTNGMEWEVLPIDGGPAIQRSTPNSNRRPYVSDRQTVSNVSPPSAPPEVPLWMDDYINNNPALDCGDNIIQRMAKRRFGWTDYGVTRDNFKVLQSGDARIPDGTAKIPTLPHGAVRSPSNLFSVTVGQLGEKGFYPVDGDDGVNVYLDDLRQDKSSLLYFACLSCAWPSTATWFTDRYVITSGTASDTMDEIDETDLTPNFPVLTLHLFDLQTGKSFVTGGIPQPAGHSRPNAPTERIYFPNSLNERYDMSWKTLWKAIEYGYHAKPEPAPFTAETVAAIAKLPVAPGLKWNDLGIWPRPENWKLASEKVYDPMDYLAAKPVAGGDPFLTYTETPDGQRQFTLAITGNFEQEQFIETESMNDVVAQADLFMTGKGSLRQLESIQRMGDNKQYLALAGTYQKPGRKDAGNGKWMLLIDLLNHRSWSANW